MAEVVEDLAAWLTAVWDEDEKRELAKQTWRSDAPPMDVTYDDDGVYVSNPGSSIRHWLSAEEYERLYLTPSPNKQVLARIAADRKILALHIGPHDCTVLVTGTYPDDWPEYIPWGKAGTEWRHPSNEYFEDLYCPTARHLAESHKDRPGFRPEWLVERQGVEG